MKKMIAISVLIILGCLWVSPVLSHNPFTSKPETQHKAPAPPVKNRFFVKLIIWQHELKLRISELIREARTTGNIKPMMLLMMLAFVYGVVHAAGPGHGKFVAMSYVLSHKASVAGGLLFGAFFAFVHGLSGAVGVLGLRYIIRQSVSETLGTVTTVTQIISFGLIALLGLGVFLKNGYAMFSKTAADSVARDTEESRNNFFPWALAAGMVPCPAVVMVMLFCLSMDLLNLGLLLAASIALGMAVTISSVVIAVVIGKEGTLQVIPKDHAELIEHILGIIAGMAVALFGSVFLIASIG